MYQLDTHDISLLAYSFVLEILLVSVIVFVSGLSFIFVTLHCWYSESLLKYNIT